MLRRLENNLVRLIVVGTLATLAVHGAYAIFSSESANEGSTVASGTLTLSNTVGTGSACLSQNGTTNVNKGCDVLLNSATLWYPVSSPTPNPGEVSVTNITVTDSGSLPASRLSIYVPSCTKVTTSGAGVVGGTSACGATGLVMYVQETDSSFNPTYCWYPTPAAGSCSLTDGSLRTFDTTYHSTATADSLGPGPTALGSRYFQVGLAEPADAANGLQGEAAQFSLMWHIDQ
jgi:hypothetical protein